MKEKTHKIIQRIQSENMDYLERLAEEENCRFVHADLSRDTNKQTILQGIAKAFRFPEHFGGNLDALADCLLELEENIDHEGFIVLLEGLPDSSVSDRALNKRLLDVFLETGKYFESKDISFRLFYSYAGS